MPVIKKHLLICLEDHDKIASMVPEEELGYLLTNFCGTVITSRDATPAVETDSIVYICGDVEDVLSTFGFIHDLTYRVVRELAYNVENGVVVGLGEVPINLYGMGVYYRQLFDFENNWFQLVSDAHTFQVLTESNKATNAFRKGLYMTDVEETKEGTEFNVLRCSTNFQGPTENFRPVDKAIINHVNAKAKEVYAGAEVLNHVLAQVYLNHTEGEKDKKAKIKAHSDKTKDMPADSLIAFTTLYKFSDSRGVKKSKTDLFDLCYGKESVLTRLKFRKKKDVDDDSLPEEFTVKLYPNSVFLISLETNRLYTHEIRPSPLPVAMIPTRIGYVIRSASTRAVHRDGDTFIHEGGELVKLKYATDGEIEELRKAYFVENTTSGVMEYPPISFTMNEGDLLKPMV